MKKIKLSNGGISTVDDSDYSIVSKYNWHLLKVGRKEYAAMWVGTKIILMHRFILGVEDNKTLVDHKDHNGLNNQQYNIRSCNRSQNGANRRSSINSTSKYLGVSWSKNKNKWQAQITINGKCKNLGRSHNEVEAAKRYDEAAIKYHGEFANLNFKGNGK